jgi:hypothetical protein
VPLQYAARIADEKSSDPPKKKEHPPSAARQRADQQRKEKLAELDRQVEEGSVVIRQMTPEERKANPPRERPKKGGSRS